MGLSDCRLRWPRECRACAAPSHRSFGPVRALKRVGARATSTVVPAMLSVASARSKERVRTEPKSSAIIGATGEKCGLGVSFDRTLAIAMAQARSARYSARAWVFGALASATTIGVCVFHAYAHGVLGSANAGRFGPRPLISEYGGYLLWMLLVGMVFMAIDARSADVRARIVEALDSRPVSNVALVSGRILGLVAVVAVPVLATVVVVAAVLLALQFWAMAVAPMYLLRAVSVVSNTAARASDIVPHFATLDTLLQRGSVLVLAAGFCIVAAAMHPRPDGVSRGRRLAWGIALVSLARAGIASVAWQGVSTVEQRSSWLAVHRGAADEQHDTRPDIQRIRGTVRIDPGETLALDIEPRLGYRGSRVAPLGIQLQSPDADRHVALERSRGGVYTRVGVVDDHAAAITGRWNNGGAVNARVRHSGPGLRLSRRRRGLAPSTRRQPDQVAGHRGVVVPSQLRGPHARRSLAARRGS